jgi:5-methylcytosine-specific restriction protein A
MTTAKKTLKDLTRDAVLKAMADADKMGHAEWLKANGYRASLRFTVTYRNRKYPSKAVVGIALGLKASEFSGGAATVQRALERCGFNMRVTPRDE